MLQSCGIYLGRRSESQPAEAQAEQQHRGLTALRVLTGNRSLWVIDSPQINPGFTADSLYTHII